MKNRLGFWKNKWLWLSISLMILLWLPSLFEPISYGDECIYLTLGQAFRQGLVYYRDIHDNKPPLLYLTAALSFGKLFWFRLFNLIWNLFHLIIIYKLGRILVKNKLAVFLGSLLFIFLLLIFEGRVANGETFMMMPVTLAVYLLLSKGKRTDFPLGLTAGLLFSFGFLFKIPIIFDFAGIILVFFAFPLKKINKKEILSLLKNHQLWGIITGFAAPVFLSIIYYSAKGAFTPYVRSALMQNIGYLSSWQGGSSGLIVRFLLLAVITLLLFWQRKKLPFYPVFFSLWFVFALFGALLSVRPYPHYLIEPVPSLVFLTILALGQLLPLAKFKLKKSVFSTLAPLVAGGLLLFSFSFYNFWWYPQISYYRNFVRYATKRINKKQYFSFWGDKTKSDYLLADFIQKTIAPNETIFVWGDAACIYATSQRLPPGRYTVNYHIYDFNGFEETLEAIKTKKPKLIIKLKNESRNWPKLNNLLQVNYLPLSLPETENQLFLRRN